MTRTIIILLLIFAQLSSSVSAQLFSSKNKFPRKGEEAETFEKAESMFEDENYPDAMLEYEKLEKDNPEEIILIFRLGVCYLQQADKIEKALQYLEKIDYVQFPNENVEYYLAIAYHKNSKYDKALMHFESFKKNKNSDKDLKTKSEQFITNCKNGVELSKNMLPYVIKNIGAPINTNASEYAPVITSDESFMMYTYRGPKSMGGLQAPFTNPKSNHGEYYEDVFYTKKNDSGNWTEPKQLPTPINNEQNNATVSIAGDGQQMFLFNSVPGDLGSISFSKLYGEEWTSPELVPGSVNSDAWEGHISLSPDKKHMIFASERSGGLGGIDLYSAELLNDFTWGNVKNLGPEINTPYDEHGPFIHPSGQFFVFSSKGHTSVGGYDLFKCLKLTDSTWTKPENMGLPLNTPLDDVFYVISGDGKHGYYSSGKAGGLGGQDIYVTSPSIFGVNIYLAEVKGNVTLNDQPIASEITITTTNNPTYKLDLKTNEATGKYLADLEPGNDYVITYTVEGLAPQTRTLETRNLREFKAYEINVQFYKKDLATTEFTKLQYMKPGDVVAEEVNMVDGKFSFKIVFERKSAYFKLLTSSPNNLKEVLVSNPEMAFDKAFLESDGFFRFPPETSTVAVVTKVDTANTTNTEMTIEDILKKYADYENGELTYHVQIGAYNFPDNFRYQVATQYGKVEKQKLDDDITRFVIGTTTKLSEARTLCKKIVDAGITDAFVTGEYRGKRYMLRDLALNKFFSEQ
jgi:hypothetical protein